MNSAHDMGGQHGMGPVAPEPDEPVFHEAWEGRAFALYLAAGRWTIDAGRHRLERIPGPDYLRMSYYERWITGLSGMLVETGVVSAGEMATGAADPAAAQATPGLTAGVVGAVLARGSPSHRTIAARPAFAVGDAVRARNLNPTGHIRLPRYVRGHSGVVTALHGAHVLPDANAHGRGEAPEPLYQVRFEAAELWGEDAAVGRGAVYVDLWESYLERV